MQYTKSSADTINIHYAEQNSAAFFHVQMLGSTVAQQHGGWGGMGVHPMMNAQDEQVRPGLGRG